MRCAPGPLEDRVIRQHTIKCMGDRRKPIRNNRVQSNVQIVSNGSDVKED